MFKRKEIERLNSRCIDLARQLKDAKLENNKLKEVRVLDIRNNKKLLEQNNKKTQLIKNIDVIVNSSKCNNEKAVFNKIKELISDYQSEN